MNLTIGEIGSVFGNRLRVRVCGICFKEDKILLVKHQPLGQKGFLWAPPGGGLQYGEHAPDCLEREINEETGLLVKTEELLFVHEFLEPPLHAVELFFKAKIVGGELKTGYDPEMPSDKQMITEVKFLAFDEIEKMDKENLHALFSLARSKEEIIGLNGYLKKK